MGTGEGAKLSQSLYKERISRLWSDAEVIRINPALEGIWALGRGQHYANPRTRRESQGSRVMQKLLVLIGALPAQDTIWPLESG